MCAACPALRAPLIWQPVETACFCAEQVRNIQSFCLPCQRAFFVHGQPCNLPTSPPRRAGGLHAALPPRASHCRVFSKAEDKAEEMRDVRVRRSVMCGVGAGMSRLDRYERAVELELSPPERVRRLIDLHPMDPAITQCLWQGRMYVQTLPPAARRRRPPWACS